jgi:hypothetical protein
LRAMIPVALKTNAAFMQIETEHRADALVFQCEPYECGPEACQARTARTES